MPDLKVYETDDEDWYAAESAEQAGELYTEVCGEKPGDGYPRELTEAEMDERLQAFDEDETPIEGETTSAREMLAKFGTEPGWLAGRNM